MKKIIIFIIGIYVFTGCGGGDWSEKLPNNYQYISESSKLTWIMWNSSNSLKEQETNTIPCSIKAYNYNEQFIIAKTKFYDLAHCTVNSDELQKLKEGQIYYYIIDTEKNIRYGVFEDKEKYLAKKKELNIKIEL